jgi:hypothetical protein
VSRPRSIILLIIWFLWSAGKDLDSLARFSTTSDYYIYSSNSLPWLFFVLAGTVFLLNAASVWYLFRPEPLGQRILLIALGAGAAYTVASLGMALSDISGARDAYTLGREVRGLPIREAALEAIFTPRAMLIGGGLTLMIYLALGALVLRNKPFFFGPSEYAAEA